MPPPDSRAAFEHNVFLLIDELSSMPEIKPSWQTVHGLWVTRWNMHGIFPTEE